MIRCAQLGQGRGFGFSSSVFKDPLCAGAVLIACRRLVFLCPEALREKCAGRATVSGGLRDYVNT
jgi:hypothetical protein